MGQGPLILGHRPAAVIDAVTETLRERGSLFSLAHDLEGQAAAAVTARMPSIELLRFGNSGTECVQYALRFARAFTGRELIAAVRGPLPRLVGRDPLVGPPLARRPGARPRRRRRAPGSTGMPRRRGDTPDRAASGTTSPPSSAAFAEHGERIAAVITEPILGNCGAHHARARLPRAHARARHRARARC